MCRSVQSYNAQLLQIQSKLRAPRQSNPEHLSTFLEANKEPRMLETQQTQNTTNNETLPSFMNTERTGTTPLMTSMDRSMASNHTEGSSRQPVNGLKRKKMRLPFPEGMVADK